MSINVFAQEVKTDYTSNKRYSDEWISTFEKFTDKGIVISKIKNKIIADTIYKAEQYNELLLPKKKRVNNINSQKVNCECKILFILQIKKKMYLLDPNEIDMTPEILNLINEQNIDKITILKGAAALALFGQGAKCGVVLLQSEDRKLKRGVKKLVR